jgi:hypothetical protein
MEQEDSIDLNDFLGKLNNEYETHQIEIERSIEKEKKILGEMAPILKNDTVENKQISSTIDREIELWGQSDVNFSFTDRESFRTSGSKQFDKINQRLNDRHDYPKVLPFQREVVGFQIRPQLSKDLEKK